MIEDLLLVGGSLGEGSRMSENDIIDRLSRMLTLMDVDYMREDPAMRRVVGVEYRLLLRATEVSKRNGSAELVKMYNDAWRRTTGHSLGDW